ncbi:MAG TPA: STAS domain-containing protein [Acidimicrobiales bacterium]|jgi:anti-sigma B factor antagonist|nr:STAS domain-containing protein [Acidimicrobiales bacterium]
MLAIAEDTEVDVVKEFGTASPSYAVFMPKIRGNLRVALVPHKSHQRPIEGLGAIDRHISARVEGLSSNGDGPQAVRLVGELDLSAATSVLGQLLDVLDCGEGLLIVDLADLTFINSSGLLVLEGASRYALEKKRLISFVNPQRLVQRLLALGGSEVAIVDGEVASRRKSGERG